jgi:hypothetical protein
MGHFIVSDSVVGFSAACLDCMSKYRHTKIVYLPPNLVDYKTKKNAE